MVRTFTNPPNLLKSKIPMSGGEGGVVGWWNQLSTFDAEFKFAKIQNSPFWGGEGKFAKIQNFHFWRGGWQWLVDSTLMLSSNLLKSKIPISGEGGEGWWNQLSTFDAEFKYAKIKNSHFRGWGGGGLVEPTFNF